MKKVFFILFLSMGLVSLKASAQAESAGTGTVFSIADSSAFVGKYKYEGLPFEYIEVSTKESKLYFVGGEYNGFLSPIPGKKDAFDVHNAAVFIFVRDDKNKVVELKIDYQGQTYIGRKEEKLK